jgi:hypothetical protein
MHDPQGVSVMPPLRAFIPKLGKNQESICSQCCQVIRVSETAPTLEEAQAKHRCGEFSLNTVLR